MDQNALNIKLPDEWHNLLHHLWTKARRDPDYVKAEWMHLEAILVRCARERQEGNRISGGNK